MRHLFNTKANILRLIEGVDSWGQPKKDVKFISTVSGCLDNLSASNQYAQTKMNVLSTHIFICEIFKVHNDDILEINGKRYEITYVDNPLNRNNHLEIELRIYE